MPSSKITPKPRVVKEQPDDAYLAPTEKYLPVYDKPAALDAILTVTPILLLPLAAPAGAGPAQGPRTSATAGASETSHIVVPSFNTGYSPIMPRTRRFAFGSRNLDTS